MSEDNDIISPLLPPHTSEQIVLSVANSPTASDLFHGENHARDGAHSGSSNPFRFIGCDELSVPSQTTVDPFRNNTPDIGGVYEWVKILLCLPIAMVRLVLLAVSLLIGYTVTRLAIAGLKDKQSPMPRWRCWIMWITRFCARCILFSFGYQYIKRKGKPVPREIAPIIVSNHISYVEPIFFFYELFPTIVASVSHDSMPIAGAIIRAMQAIYVDRFSESSRKRVVKEIKNLLSRIQYTEEGFLR